MVASAEADGPAEGWGGDGYVTGCSPTSKPGLCTERPDGYRGV